MPPRTGKGRQKDLPAQPKGRRSPIGFLTPPTTTKRLVGSHRPSIAGTMFASGSGQAAGMPLLPGALSTPGTYPCPLTHVELRRGPGLTAEGGRLLPQLHPQRAMSQAGHDGSAAMEDAANATRTAWLGKEHTAFILYTVQLGKRIRVGGMNFP